MFLLILLAQVTAAFPAQVTQALHLFTLQLWGPFSGGVRAGFHRFPALWDVVSTLTRPLHSLCLAYAAAWPRMLGSLYHHQGRFVKWFGWNWWKFTRN